MAEIKRRGLMLVLSSPSGAGKTTISRLLLERDKNLRISISVTTRPKRPGEVEGQDYFFITQPEFESLVKQRQLLEYANVFGNWYGTPRKFVEEALQSGRDVLFDIDWQGNQQLREAARQDVVGVFILPPSTKELERRLFARSQDTADVVARRMAEWRLDISRITDEMSHWPEYDYIVVNTNIPESLEQVASILAAERLRRERQVGLNDFVRALKE